MQRPACACTCSRACWLQVADDVLSAALSPPAHLIVSTALTSVGGSHLDESTLNKDCEDLEAAQTAFRRALEWWPANGMALVGARAAARPKRPPTHPRVGVARC